MRYLFAIMSLSLACCLIVFSKAPLATSSWVCRAGLCQLDAIPSEMAPSGSVSPRRLVFRLNESPSDPYLWSDYADSLVATGDSDKASAAFEQAVRLGPNLPPVLIRAAYFAFSHNEFERGATLSGRILNETPAFDPLVFSYLHYFGQGRPGTLESVVPASRRPAQAWASWIADNGSESEVRQTFLWMQRNRLLDQPATLNLTWKLWRRQFFGSAQELWANWVGLAEAEDHFPEGGDSNGELLANRQFGREPNGSPFDWTIPKDASVVISRGQGLAIHFLGTANVKLEGVQQSVIVKPGRYRFSAVLGSDGLTTDQRPFFQIFDPANSKRLNAELPPIGETTPKTATAYDITIPPGTDAVTIELLRRPSDRFDNKIQGTLHVFEVSLIRLGANEDQNSAVTRH